MKKIFTILILSSIQLFAQCPTDYADNTADIQWVDNGGILIDGQCPPNTGASLTGRADIVFAFNNARTVENGQIGTTIPANMTVTDLAADDNAWDNKSSSEKALILMNLERVARGIPPFQEVDANVVNVAQSYADYLRTNNQFEHNLDCNNGSSGTNACNAIVRMEENAAIKTHQQAACRFENLAAVFAPSMDCAPLFLEQAIYSWIYNDTGQGNGHRKACFYNIPIANDDYSTAGAEGQIGIGVSIGLYQGAAYGIVMVFNFFDPDASYNPALPVELTAFTANLNSNKVELLWQTATEVNNYGFDVERQKKEVSSQNSVWEKLAFVEGHGNSNSPKSYSFTDNTSNASGKFLYRLKQIDIDGTFEYSDAVEINLGAPKRILS
ncbi:MAG: hypothetical protein H6613_18845 [Ignavibacteriales bacterium]|nr:hypothetical protein [Ignavibacteriales bacterium]